MNLSNNPFFVLYSNCIPVKGYNRSIIMDLQRNEYHFVPNSLVEILIQLRDTPVIKLMDSLSDGERIIFNEYIQFIKERDLGFFTSNPNQFPKISEDFTIPYFISDIIIELSSLLLDNLDLLIKQLVSSGVRFIEIRMAGKLLGNLNLFLKKLSDTRVRCVQIYCRYDDHFDLKLLETYLDEYPAISEVTVHSCPVNFIEENKTSLKLSLISKTISNNDCGRIDKQFFSANLEFYLLSKKFNNCLFKKVSVSPNGDIRNCPSIGKIHGNILHDSLVEVSKSESYLNITSINKDKVSVCRDCEFRYICSDCRAYSDNPLAKPKFCNYNPYTNEYE